MTGSSNILLSSLLFTFFEEYLRKLYDMIKELKAKKDKLLLVLHRPEASLHNNDSERDIKEYVKRRKISAGTRSENGKRARDTFLSLKKTCRKLGISFWGYLLDRLTNANNILPLSLIMEQQSMTAKACLFPFLRGVLSTYSSKSLRFVEQRISHPQPCCS